MMHDAEKLAAGLHPLERAVVPHLNEEGLLSELAASAKLQEVEAMRALQWLEGKGCLALATTEKEILQINETGKRVQKDGWPITFVEQALAKKGTVTIDEIRALLPEYDKGAFGSVLGYLKENHVPFDPQKGTFRSYEGMKIPPVESAAALDASSKHGWTLEIDEKNRTHSLDLQRRGYGSVVKRREKSYTLTPLGISLTKAENLQQEYEERLTPQALRDKTWKQKKFRPYNVTVNVPRKSGGREHFVNEARDYIRSVWLDLGFEEMEGNHVQTAFWDLDALFVPQDHPAREMQDTFYLKEPAKGEIPREIYELVKAAHENGGDTGSLGWRYKFNEEESKRNLLRTHTTVLSAQTLWKIKQGLKKMPGKYFSVSTVYRNEAPDWKHLFEFHQVEGIVVDENANLQHLKGYLRIFFGKMGFPDVRIRPGHFPYCEPSGEIDVFDPQRQQWVELGGCGIFRPEVTKTLIGKEVPVLAWGLGMERIIKEYYGLSDVRDLYRNDLKQLKSMKMWMK
jgi:phenylalanyl-tRNA synthetase alpha chain